MILSFTFHAEIENVELFRYFLLEKYELWWSIFLCVSVYSENDSKL